MSAPTENELFEREYLEGNRFYPGKPAWYGTNDDPNKTCPFPYESFEGRDWLQREWTEYTEAEKTAFLISVEDKTPDEFTFEEKFAEAAQSRNFHRWAAEAKKRREGLPPDRGFARAVEDEVHRARVRREAQRQIAEADEALLDRDLPVDDDWAPKSPAELNSMFAEFAGAEWVESIAPKGSKSTIFGPSMSAKTVFLNHVAVAGANASPDGTSTVFGKTIFEPFGTLFITLEDQYNQHARLDAAARMHGWSTDGVLVVTPTSPPHVGDPESLTNLVVSTRAAQKRLRDDYGLPLGQVIIDTGKYLVAGKDTNSTESHSLVTTLMAKISGLTQGAYVAVVTHTPLSDDDRPVGSHDQTASRDHSISIKNVHGTRQVTLAKHKFQETPSAIGQFKVVPKETPFALRSMPVLVEHGAASAAFDAGASKVASEARTKLSEVRELMDFFTRQGNDDGWVDQGQVQANQASDGFGKNKATRVRDLIDSIDDSIIQVDSVSTGRAVRKRWRVRPDLDHDQVIETVMGALDLDD